MAQLTPEAERILTRELREAVGDERARLPQPGERRPAHPHGPIAANLVANRQILLVTLAVAIVFGVFLSLVTGSWWALVAAVAVHALGTAAVAGGSLRLAGLTEHVSPDVAARLEDEGIADPDRVLTELVAEHGAERAAPARARPAAPAAGSSAAAALPWGVSAFLLAFGIAVAAWFGGTMWVLPAIVVVLCAGWIALQSRVPSGARADAREARPHTALPAMGLLVVGVAAFMIVMGFLTHAL